MKPESTPEQTATQSVTTDDAVTAETLIEEVSIDGMCGVY